MIPGFSGLQRATREVHCENGSRTAPRLRNSGRSSLRDVTTIGAYDLVWSETFMAQDLQPARVPVEVRGESVVFEITFDPDVNFTGALSWEPRAGNTIALKFKGWREINAGFPEPVRLGDIGSVPLFVQLAHSRLGPGGVVGANLVHFFVLTKAVE